MQWLELHPEFGMEVAKYRAGLSGAIGENKDISTANLVPWKPDPKIVDMWKRWAQEQEDFKRAEEQEDIERALKSETDGAPDPTKQHDDSQGQAGRRPANRPGPSGGASRCMLWSWEGSQAIPVSLTFRLRVESAGCPSLSALTSLSLRSFSVRGLLQSSRRTRGSLPTCSPSGR